MVKLKGPGMAQDASGSLAETLIFSKWKGVSYLKKHAKPRQPKTQSQVAMRSILRFLSEEWKKLTVLIKANWTPLAARKNISNFNAFQSFNLARWRSGQSPSRIPTTDTAGSWGDVPDLILTPVSRGIQFDITVVDPGARWANLLYHVVAPADPKRWDLFFHAIQSRFIGTTTWTWRPLDPGTYYVTIGACKVHGELWSGQFNRSAIVT